MRKLIFLGLLLCNTVYADEGLSDFQNYLIGMKFYDDGVYDKAINPLKLAVTSNSLKPNIKAYAVIALAVIDEKANQFSDSISILSEFLTGNGTNISIDAKKDMLVMESRLCRQNGIDKISESYSIANDAKEIAPDDPGTLLNYSVAGLQYAGVLKQKAATDVNNKKNLLSKATSILNDSLLTSQNIVSTCQDTDLLSQTYNTMGRIQYLNCQFSEAEKSFQKAYSLVDRPIFHRNRGWALLDGLDSKMRGKAKLEMLKETLLEFDIAQKSGVIDLVTQKQITSLERVIKELSVKYEKMPNKT